MAWTSGPLVEFRRLHTVVVGLISRCRDHGVHCWWDLIRSKQLFSAPYFTCRCVPDFTLYIYIERERLRLKYLLHFKLLLSGTTGLRQVAMVAPSCKYLFFFFKFYHLESWLGPMYTLCFCWNVFLTLVNGIFATEKFSCSFHTMSNWCCLGW